MEQNESNKNHTINLVIGDWSDDGHGKKDKFTIKCNLDKKALEKAYKKGVKKVGVDITSDVAHEYEDSTISKEDWDKLLKAGMKADEVGEVDIPDHLDGQSDRIFIWPDAFADIWLFVAKAGNPKFEFEHVIATASNINIGGYGLFID
jgi:hypothetical protein